MAKKVFNLIETNVDGDLSDFISNKSLLGCTDSGDLIWSFSTMAQVRKSGRFDFYLDTLEDHELAEFIVLFEGKNLQEFVEWIVEYGDPFSIYQN